MRRWRPSHYPTSPEVCGNTPRNRSARQQLCVNQPGLCSPATNDKRATPRNRTSWLPGPLERLKAAPTTTMCRNMCGEGVEGGTAQQNIRRWCHGGAYLPAVSHPSVTTRTRPPTDPLPRRRPAAVRQPFRDTPATAATLRHKRCTPAMTTAATTPGCHAGNGPATNHVQCAASRKEREMSADRMRKRSRSAAFLAITVNLAGGNALYR